MEYTGTANPITKQSDDTFKIPAIFTEWFQDEDEVLDVILSLDVSPEDELLVPTYTINDEPFKDENKQIVPVGHAVEITMSGGMPGDTYKLKLKVITNQGNRFTLTCPVEVEP